MASEFPFSGPFVLRCDPTDLRHGRISTPPVECLMTTAQGSGEVACGSPTRTSELALFWLDASTFNIGRVLGSNVIRLVNLSTGTIFTIGGNSSAGYSGDGGCVWCEPGICCWPMTSCFVRPASLAQFEAPLGVLADGSGGVWVAGAWKEHEV